MGFWMKRNGVAKQPHPKWTILCTNWSRSNKKAESLKENWSFNRRKETRSLSKALRHAGRLKLSCRNKEPIKRQEGTEILRWRREIGKGLRGGHQRTELWGKHRSFISIDSRGGGRAEGGDKRPVKTGSHRDFTCIFLRRVSTFYHDQPGLRDLSTGSVGSYRP